MNPSLPMSRSFLAGVATLVLGLGVLAPEAAAQTVELHMATIAPSESDWGKVLNKGGAEIAAKTGGRVKINYYMDGSQGGESDYIAKMKSGALDGAGVTAVGLSLIDESIRVLELPMMYDTVEEVDYVADKMWSYFQKKFEKLGYKLNDRGDVGWIHVMSKAKVDSMASLRSLKLWKYGSDKVYGPLYSKLGLDDEEGQGVHGATHLIERIKVDPKLADAYHNLARVYVQQGQAGKAVVLYQSYLKIAPGDHQARNNLGGIYCALKQYDKAIETLQSVLVEDPRNIQAYRNLARVYFDQGNFRLSQLLSANALKLSPDDPGVHNNMGVTYLKLGEERAAIQSFRRAIELNASNREANFNLGTVALQSGDYELARSSFERILQKYPGDIEAQLGFAVALRGQQEYKEVVKLYEKVLSQDPSNRMTLYNLGIVHEKYLQDFDMSLRYFERYATLLRNTPEEAAILAKIEEVRQEKTAYLETKRKEEKRIAKEKAEADRRALAQAEREKAETETRAKLVALIQDTERRMKENPSKLPKQKLEPVQSAVDQSKMVAEQGDLDMLREAFTYLESAARELKQ